MEKVKIGILPSSRLFENDNPYDDRYVFINNYSKKIYESGGVPVGILLSDNELDYSSLEMCDGFLICGGNIMQPYLFKTIDYAIKYNKPILGICLGMQAIGLYSYLEQNLLKQKLKVTYENILSEYEKIKEQKVYFLKPIEGHYKSIITRDKYLQNKHNVKINRNSVLNDIYNCNELSVLSMHSYEIATIGDNVYAGAVDNNGIIESIEYKNKDLFVLGVQWHPEIEKEHKVLFDRLICEAKQRQ